MAPPGGSSGSSGSGGSGGVSVALDPIKLFKQYAVWLIAAGVLGVALGIGAYMALLRYAPQFRSEVVFEFLAPITEADQQAGVGSNRTEIELFIGSQVYLMSSDSILTEAVGKREIQQETEWARQFVRDNGRFDTRAATRELQDIVNVRAVPESNIVILSATAPKAQDAATIADGVKEVFMRNLEQKVTVESQDILEALTRQLTAAQEERRLLEERMARLLEENQITSLDERLTAQQQTMQDLLPVLHETRRQLEASRGRLEQYETQLSAPGGAVYPEEVRAAMREDPVILSLERRIADSRVGLNNSLKNLGRNHRTIERIRRTIDALEEQMREEEEKALEEQFIQVIELTRNDVRTLEAQETELLATIEDAQTRLNEIKQVVEQYENLQRDAARRATEQQELDRRIAEQRAVIERAASKRVKVQAAAQVPDRPSFPNILVIVPAATVLCLGLVGGVIVLRELLEQRVRGPADVGLISRTPMLGVVPETSEDPSNPKSIETAVRDRPTGVVAESIRQIRTTVLKRCNERGHKALLVVGGMPRSGATSVILNLAESLAMVDQRVLVIDANFRRPAIHKRLALSEEPGLGDVLAGAATLAEAAQSTQVDGVRALTVGSAGSRVYERLNTTAMSRVLDQARAEYDFVLIDTTPAIVSGDAVALAHRCDAAAMVVRAYGETRGLVARVRNQLGDTRSEFLGVVVNAVRSSAGGYFKRNFRVAHEYQNGLASKSELRDRKREEKVEAGA